MPAVTMSHYITLIPSVQAEQLLITKTDRLSEYILADGRSTGTSKQVFSKTSRALRRKLVHISCEESLLPKNLYNVYFIRYLLFEYEQIRLA